MVLPTKRNPRRFMSFDSLSLSAVEAGTSAWVAKWLTCGRPSTNFPEIGIETAMRLPHGKNGVGISAGAVNLQPVADDSRIVAEGLQLVIRHGGDTVKIEIMEDRSVAGPFLQHHFPAEARLRAFQGQHLEQMPVIMHRHTPFGVMVMRQRILPGAVAKAAGQPVG